MAAPNIDGLGYDDLLTLEKQIKGKKKELEGNITKKKVVIFKPKVQSGLDISVPATVLQAPGPWDTDKNTRHLYVHGNKDFPESYCVTSASKLRPCNDNSIKPIYDKIEKIPGNIRRFTECSKCKLDTHVGCCNCYHSSMKKEYSL
jgi:hypothetical protein